MERILVDETVRKIIFTLLAVTVAIVLSLISKNSLNFFFGRISTRIGDRETLLAKSQTLYSLSINLITIVIIVLLLMIVLSAWGVNIGPILTGAGVLGLAFSFGAQTLVKDVISGFFIIAEDQYNIGDRIKIGTNEGRVVRITLRLTVIQTDEENIIYIPNSEVKNVIRYPHAKLNIIRSSRTIPRVRKSSRS